MYYASIKWNTSTRQIVHTELTALRLPHRLSQSVCRWYWELLMDFSLKQFREIPSCLLWSNQDTLPECSFQEFSEQTSNVSNVLSYSGYKKREFCSLIHHPHPACQQASFLYLEKKLSSRWERRVGTERARTLPGSWLCTVASTLQPLTCTCIKRQKASWCTSLRNLS